MALAAYFGIPQQFWDNQDVEQAIRLDVALIGDTAAALRSKLVLAASTLETGRLRELEEAIERLRSGDDVGD